MATPWMSIVIPTYNEEAAIGDVVAAARSWLEASGRSWEIIVVDNASEDGTRETVAPLLEERILLLENDVNRGKGFSIRRGMLEARGELRLMCDADCTRSLASLDRMVAATAGADVVAGSRVADGADVGREQPIRRRIVGWPFIALTRLTLREPTRDVYCGFKVWRAAAAEAVFARQRVLGWAFDAESLAMARGLGFRVSEIGIEWTDRTGSKLSIIETLVPAVKELLAARRSVRDATRANPVGATVTAASEEAGPPAVEPQQAPAPPGH